MSDKAIDVILKYMDSVPVNIEAMAGELGLRVNKNAELPEGISGHLKRTDDGKYVISSNRKEHEYRQRFTLAHEIGHFVLHKNLVDAAGGVDDDTRYRSTERGDIYNSEIELYHEKQANSFSAYVLMPERLIREWLEGQRLAIPDEKPLLTDLYRHFRVSPSAMRWRLKNLDLYNEVRDDAAP